MRESEPNTPEGENPTLSGILDELYDYNNLHGYMAAGETDALPTLRTFDTEMMTEDLVALRKHLEEVATNLRAATEGSLTSEEISRYRDDLRQKPESQLTPEDIEWLREYHRKVRLVYEKLTSAPLNYTDGDLGVARGTSRNRPR